MKVVDLLGSSPALATKLEFYLGRLYFVASVMLANSQLFCLPPVGMLNITMVNLSLSD